jgi:8-oxo-dGTP diphosphatase
MGSKNTFSYSYPRPALTVDAVLFSFTGNELKVLLIQRADEPFKNRWAFPGGFVEENEKVDSALEREIQEETSLAIDQYKQFYFASGPGRDPRGWTVSCCYVGFVNWENADIKAGDDARNALWYSLIDLPPLAFDHEHIFLKAQDYLKRMVRFSIINSELLPEVFLLEQMHSIYFQITGSREESDVLLQRLIDKRIIVPHTYRDLYTFHNEQYEKVRRYGFI